MRRVFDEIDAIWKRLLDLERRATHGGGGLVAGAHAPNHEDGQGDELDVTTLAGFPGGSPSTYLDSDGQFTTPPGSGPHASDHYDGGSDEVDITQLGGFPGGSPLTYLDSSGAFSDPGTGGSGSFSGAMVKKSADQTGANYSLAAGGGNIAFDAEAYDVGGWHDNVTNNTRLTVPSGVNYVVIAASVTMSNVVAGQWIGLFLLKNGSASGAFDGATAFITSNDSATGPSVSFASGAIPVTAGDYFECFLMLESDTSIDITAARCMFSIRAVG
jgi:hypothetical protein